MGLPASAIVRIGFAQREANMWHRLGRFSLVFAATGFLSACGSSYSSSPTPNPTPNPNPTPGSPQAADVTITILGINGGMSFAPAAATVRVGQSVAWRNADGIAHTATQNNGTFDTGNIAGGATSRSIVMSTAGVLAYRCGIHPSMTGSITVNP